MRHASHRARAECRHRRGASGEGGNGGLDRRVPRCPDYEKGAPAKPLELLYERLDDQLPRRFRRCATRHMPGTRKYKGQVVRQI